MYISSGSFSALCSSSSRNWVIEAGFALLNVWLVILQSQKFLCLLTLQQHSWRYIAQVGTSQRKEQRVPSSGLNCQFSHLDCFQVFLEILCLSGAYWNSSSFFVRPEKAWALCCLCKSFVVKSILFLAWGTLHVSVFLMWVHSFGKVLEPQWLKAAFPSWLLGGKQTALLGVRTSWFFSKLRMPQSSTSPREGALLLYPLLTGSGSDPGLDFLSC